MSVIQIAGTIVGSTIGALTGGPLGAIKGAALGYEIGGGVNSLVNPKSVTVTGPRLADLSVQISSYGKPIQRIYGRMRVAGNVIWMQPLKEVATSSSQGAGKGGGGVKQTTTTYSYFATLAIAICEGPIDRILQVWGDSELLTDQMLGSESVSYNIYLGNETQLPDPIIESFEGTGNVPAYRGTSYVVIKDFPLANYGNRIPNFTFEIQRELVPADGVENQIKAITLIPGDGEVVYDTVIQKYVNTITNVASAPINMNNAFNIADVIPALDALGQTFPNLEWVSVVVPWYATSLDAGACTIVPKVAVKGDITTSPDPWVVGSFTRDTADQCLTSYTGTPSDLSVLRLLLELKNRGYNVLFSPTVYVDITSPLQPWRGSIAPANEADAVSFFNKTNGYNDFIAHYLNLSNGTLHLSLLIDAFSIGSELVGMTSATFNPGVYKAVEVLKIIAASANTVLPDNVAITYSANWNEYHSDANGWYNMDPLWSDSNITFVGIDAYFPLTEDLPQSEITYQKVYDGWTSGEYWDYVWNVGRTVKIPITPAEAWKNIAYWWSHTHINPDSSGTDWNVKMKPIWFTQFGFPSVDACSNEPSAMYDPNSSTSAWPRESLHRIDFQAQKVALSATEAFLTDQNSIIGNSNLIPTRFVYAWDARPYPQFPNLTSVWNDADLWITGYWVEGKVGVSTVGAIVENLISEVDITQYDVSSIQDVVSGYCINAVTDVSSNISELKTPFLFDVVESSGVLKFVKRGQSSAVTVPQDNIVPPANSGDIRSIAKITRTQEVDLPQLYSASYYNQANNYDQNTQIAQRQTTHSINQVNLAWNLSLDDQTAQNIVNSLLYTDWMNRNRYQFTLSPQYCYIEPTDVITLTINNVNRVLRILTTDMLPNGSQNVTAVTEDMSTYDFYQVPGSTITNQQLPNVIPDTQLDLLDLPAFPHDSWTDIYMTVADCPIAPNWNGAVLYRSDDGGMGGGNTYIYIEPLTIKSTIGLALTVLGVGNSYTWDYANTVDVQLVDGTLSSATMLSVLNGANSAVIGNEIIQFLNAELIDTNTYRLSGLLRGRLGTEDQIAIHAINDKFVLLNTNITRLIIPISLINILSYYKCVSVGAFLADTQEQAFTYNARQLKPYSPVQITGTRDISLNLTINWVRRTRVGGEMRDASEVPLSEQDERYEVDIYDGLTVVRTIPSVTPSAYYSAADQTIDFGSPQSSIDVRVYQISATVGRGIPGIATV